MENREFTLKSRVNGMSYVPVKVLKLEKLEEFIWSICSDLRDPWRILDFYSRCGVSINNIVVDEVELKDEMSYIGTKDLADILWSNMEKLIEKYSIAAEDQLLEAWFGTDEFRFALTYFIPADKDAKIIKDTPQEVCAISIDAFVEGAVFDAYIPVAKVREVLHYWFADRNSYTPKFRSYEILQEYESTNKREEFENVRRKVRNSIVCNSDVDYNEYTAAIQSLFYTFDLGYNVTYVGALEEDYHHFHTVLLFVPKSMKGDIGAAIYDAVAKMKRHRHTYVEAYGLKTPITLQIN